MTKLKKAVVKLGGECNLKCKNCHCMPMKYKYNSDIIQWISDNKIELIGLCGGEPFLFFDIIKEIVPRLNFDTIKRIQLTTNGTLVTQEIIDFCRQYNIFVAISYDGRYSKRDGDPANLELISQLDGVGTSSVFYHDNTNIHQIIYDIKELAKKYDLSSKNSKTVTPMFVHQTQYSPNADTTKEDAKQYIQQICQRMEYSLMSYKQEDPVYGLGTVFWFIKHFLNHEPYTVGCKCCNPNNVSLAIDGRFLLCPYGDTFVGDIYNGVDWEKVDSYVPIKCKKCSLRSICGSACIAQITDNECYIFRCLYKHYKKLLKKYNIDEEKILNSNLYD